MDHLGIKGITEAELVASGGTSLVYRARTDQGALVALKVFRGTRGPKVERRFEREVSAYRRVGAHRLIVDLIGSGITSAGEPYLVMPFYELGSVQDELDTSGAKSVAEAVAIVSQVCEALDFAHSQGVLHRDIKPGNLLRHPDGSVMLTDFGVARVAGAGISSATMGFTTPLYAAPEVLEHQDASVFSESYSLGALLYALLNGAPAFSSQPNFWSAVNLIRNQMPPVIEGVPKPLMDVILSSMSKMPQLRPASAAAFSQQVQSALNLDPAQVITSTYPNVVIEPARVANRGSVGHFETSERRSWMSLALVFFVAAILALFVFFGYRTFKSTVLTVDEAALEDSSVPSPTQGPTVEQTPVPPAEPSTEPTSQPTPVAGTEPAPEPDPTDPLPPGLSGSGDSSGGSKDGSPPVSSGSAGGAGDVASSSGSRVESGYFQAQLPSGWAVAQYDADVGYGFRTRLRSRYGYMNIDTTPALAREPGTDVRSSAREIAAKIPSASSVQKRSTNGIDFYWFTFTNEQGVPSIDIFFEVDGAGYAVVAGSKTEKDQAFAGAWLIAETTVTN